MAPRTLWSDSSAQYMGMVLVSKPRASPAMNRPAIIIAMLVVPACKAHPKTEIAEPVKMAHRRPRMSPSQYTDAAPTIAPPVMAETMPPLSESVMDPPK